MSAMFSKHMTIAAGAAQQVTATNLSWTDGTPRLRVINRTGTGEVYFNVSIDPNAPATVPTATKEDNSYVLPQVICEEFVPVPGLDRTLDIWLIASADTEISVVLDAAHALYGK